MHKRFEYHQVTAIGDRPINQDCTAQLVNDRFGLFVVADGLGGHHAGDLASKYFCRGVFSVAEQFHDQLRKTKTVEIRRVFHQWVSAAVKEMEVYFAGDEGAKDAYTTCAMLYFDDQFVISVHCGDSRIYRLNPARVVWRTKDHSLIQKQLEQGQISEREMGLHPEQNQLIRSINIKQDHQAEINIYPPALKGETFILCTDGFWEYIKESDLLRLAALGSGRTEFRKAVQMMHLRAKGNSDNLTAQWIRCLA